MVDPHQWAWAMMMAEQTQGYRISLELTKPVQSGFVGTWSWSSTFCWLRLDPECVTSVMSSQSHALNLWFTSHVRVSAISIPKITRWNDLFMTEENLKKTSCHISASKGYTLVYRVNNIIGIKTLENLSSCVIMFEPLIIKLYLYCILSICLY